VKNQSSKSKNNLKPTKRAVSKKNEKETDIVSLILRDHKPIKDLIVTLKDSEVSIAKKRPAFAEFERMLSSHAKAEEESLYVHLKQVDDLRVEGLEGDTEHAIADHLMKEINESKSDEDTWMAKVKVLAELVDHHVKEEEKDILKEVRKEFSAEECTEIGETYSQLLKKYREEGVQQKRYNSKDEMRAEHV
jgi:Hemerythrin HHE cation binding domain